MKVVTVNLEDIKEAEYNPRVKLKRGDKMYNALKKSVDDFGLVVPLIINERTNTLVSGHQRLSVLRDKGVKQTDAIYIDLPENKEKSLCIALNKINGEWEYGKLSEILQEIGEEAVNIGFANNEVSELLGEIQQEEEDDTQTEDIEMLAKLNPARNGKIKVTVGTYTFKITETEYEDLMASIHESVGWSKMKIEEEIIRRLTNG